MEAARVSGILLHPTSLPGRLGIGDLGPEAARFVDFLAGAGQGVWQVLPLGPTGYGDSPYQSLSAFAGNPLLVSPEALAEEGLLAPRDVEKTPWFPHHEVDFAAVIPFRVALLSRAAEVFRHDATGAQRAELEAFCRRHASWLPDFALFAALKDAHGGVAWTQWEPGVASRSREGLARWSDRLSAEVEARKLWQFFFFKQWSRLRQLCHARGIRLMGDVPIFVAHDSADVWAHPEYFQLLPDGRPAVVAGVPPDYFSVTGQLWGNPLYRWEALARSGYLWWVERFRGVLEVVDLVRLDHFRGFEAYWEVPGDASTAIGGRWVPGPGAAFFEAVAGALGSLPIVAENLGVITPEVEALRERFGFPGMAVLQFAFGSEPIGSSVFLPHNHTRNLVVYTGTHDNDTAVGWWTAGVGDTTRSAHQAGEERAYARKYLATDGREVHWALVRAALASVARTAVVPLQDVLGLGSEARMNLPGRPGGNWTWRVLGEQLTDAVRDRLLDLTMTYGRFHSASAAVNEEGL